MLFKAKGLYSSSKSQWNVLNLIFRYNFTFTTTKQRFSTLLTVILRLFMKNWPHEWKARCIGRCILSDFKMWSSLTMNNCSIIMVHNSDSIRILWVCIVFVANFWGIQIVAPVNFTLFLNILRILKTLLWKFWKRNLLSCGLFFPNNWIKVLVVQCKQPWLLKLKLKIDLNFRLKISKIKLVRLLVKRFDKSHHFGYCFTLP